MKRFLRILRWTVINIAGLALLIAALYYEQGWAWNIFRFFAGLACLYLLTSVVECINDIDKLEKFRADRPKPTVSGKVDLMPDVITILILVIYGKFFWAIIWLCNTGFGQFLMFTPLEKLRKAKTQANTKTNTQAKANEQAKPTPDKDEFPPSWKEWKL